LRKVLAGGEPGLGQLEIRERISAGLGIAHLRETMGLGDVISGMWSECEAQEGMHFNAQRHVAIELIDPDTHENIHWREGAEGELVYTAFAREAAPVVRYRSRDHVSVVATRCACGRTSPRIHCIGRTDDMLVYKGMNVFPTSIRASILEAFAKDVEPIVRVWKEYASQVRFDEPIVVEVEASAGFDLAQAENLAREIEQQVRTRLQVRIAVHVLKPGGLEKSVYKNAILAVREPRLKARVGER
jgi:phenylacetate-CoA ligase/benzoylacetate-CoA ligase